jgi:hypothetical protein
MDILKMGTYYPGVLTVSQLTEISRYYQALLGANPQLENQIKNNVIEHIKNSKITVSETELIQFYISIFSSKDVSFLYDAFKMKKEEVCLEVKTQALSIITLSNKELMLINLEFQEVVQMCSLFYIYRNFPSFYPFSQNKESIQITVESNVLSEKKVVLLFNHLVQSCYHFETDKKQEFKKLLELMAKINDMVDLDSSLIAEKNTKHHQRKRDKKKEVKI